MIYFISQGAMVGAVKIGFTDESTPNSRLSHLQVGNPDPLYVLAFGPGSEADEENLHTLHRKDWIRGEWFRMTNPVFASAMKTGVIQSVPIFQEDSRRGKALLRKSAWLTEVEAAVIMGDIEKVAKLLKGISR